MRKLTTVFSNGATGSGACAHSPSEPGQLYDLTDIGTFRATNSNTNNYYLQVLAYPGAATYHAVSFWISPPQTFHVNFAVRNSLSSTVRVFIYLVTVI
jgi:hypothetical protein